MSLFSKHGNFVYLLCSMVAWGMEQSIFNPRLTRDMLLRVRKELDLIVTLTVNRRALASGIFHGSDWTFSRE